MESRSFVEPELTEDAASWLSEFGIVGYQHSGCNSLPWMVSNIEIYADQKRTIEIHLAKPISRLTPPSKSTYEKYGEAGLRKVRMVQVALLAFM